MKHNPTPASVQQLLQERQPLAGQRILSRGKLPPDGGGGGNRLGLGSERLDHRITFVADFLQAPGRSFPIDVLP